MKVLIVAALAALAASAPTPAQFETARKLLDEQLLDYPSARFRDVTAEASHICGTVNARNRLTAYTGWQRFVVTLEGDAKLYFAEGPDTVMVDTFCAPETTPKSRDYSDRLSAH